MCENGGTCECSESSKQPSPSQKSYLRCLNWTGCQTPVVVCHLRICQVTIKGREEGGGSSSGDECGIRYCECSKCSVLLKTMLLLDANVGETVKTNAQIIRISTWAFKVHTYLIRGTTKNSIEFHLLD